MNRTDILNSLKNPITRSADYWGRDQAVTVVEVYQAVAVVQVEAHRNALDIK